MKTIFKYGPIPVGSTVSLLIPNEAHILHFSIQHGQIFLWALVDSEKPIAALNFAAIGTGWEIPDEYTYVGTVMDEEFVWHVFQV